MDQVRFELTSSRSIGEVTLPYTTSNSSCLRNLSAVFVAQARPSGPEAIPSPTANFNREE